LDLKDFVLNSQDDISLESDKLDSSPTRPESTSAAITETFDHLIASKTFSRSGQLKRLLVYLRNATDSTDPSVWSETYIGAKVFGRKDFNPKLDTIVRVEIRRLRQKLEEFYAGEGAALPLRLRFEKKAYRPYVEPNIQPEIERHRMVDSQIVDPEPVEPHILDLAPAGLTSRFWMGVASGAGSLLLLTLAVGLAWWTLGANSNRAARDLAESPIWSGFRSSNVVVAIGTNLFFRSVEGYERSFQLNLPEDLQVADQFLLRKPAAPLWNFWAPFEDVAATVNLDRFLQGLNSSVSVISARQLSSGGLAGRRTIVMGQPRGAPLLIDLLADQNFRPPPHTTGEEFSGFVNTEPKPGEARHFPVPTGKTSRNFGMMESDESDPDYALVTSIRLNNGGEVLSVFGDRSQTGAYVTRRLTDPAFVSELNGRVFDHGRTAHQSAQIVFRVDYSRGVPTGLVYVTHRIHFAVKK
jgi:hypothetical protein